MKVKYKTLLTWLDEEENATWDENDEAQHFLLSVFDVQSFQIYWDAQLNILSWKDVVWTQ